MIADVAETLRKPPVAVLAVLLLAVGLLLDLVPRFTLGDSASYLSSEIGTYLPDDRSWAYGLLASAVTRLSRDLAAMALGQIILAWGCAVLVANAVARHFGLGGWFRIAGITVLSWGPLSYYWAHAFMTDSLAATASGALLALLLASFGIVPTSIGVFVLGCVLAALRSVYLPPLIAANGMVAALCALRAIRAALRREERAGGHMRGAARFAAVALALLLATTGDGLLNKLMLNKTTTSTNYATSRFLVSAWSPLLGPAVARLDLPLAVTQGMEPLTFDNRLRAAFSPDGLVERLRDHFGGYDGAEPTYRVLARSALLDHPAAFAALVARSWSDYVDPGKVLLYHHQRALTGTNNWGTGSLLDQPLIDRLLGWGVWQHPAPDLPRVPSFGLSYLSDMGGYWALLLAFHATLAGPLYFFLPRRFRNDNVLAIQLFAFGYMAMVAATSNDLVTRYLLPLDVAVLISLGGLAALLRRRAIGHWERDWGGLTELAERPQPVPTPRAFGLGRRSPYT